MSLHIKNPHDCHHLVGDMRLTHEKLQDVCDWIMDPDAEGITVDDVIHKLLDDFRERPMSEDEQVRPVDLYYLLHAIEFDIMCRYIPRPRLEDGRPLQFSVEDSVEIRWLGGGEMASNRGPHTFNAVDANGEPMSIGYGGIVAAKAKMTKGGFVERADQ